jgi:hypothetical protein
LRDGQKRDRTQDCFIATSPGAHHDFGSPQSCLSAIYAGVVTPTVFREGPFRVHFFSLEESRMHVHIVTSDGEAKIWMEPEIELANNYGLSEQVLNRALKLVSDRQQEIRDAWHEHFSR